MTIKQILFKIKTAYRLIYIFSSKRSPWCVSRQCLVCVPFIYFLPNGRGKGSIPPPRLSSSAEKHNKNLINPYPADHLSGMKCVSQHQDLQIFLLTLNKDKSFSAT